jgi:tetratricopeptide (TPR) repeat protein
MKPSILSISTLGALLLAAWMPASLAGPTYSESLKAGDEAMNTGKNEDALKEFEAAVGQAASPQEKALAQGKAAYVLAFKLKDYAKARKLAEEAGKTAGLTPLAEMTVCQVLAECQMRADKNYLGAALNLEKALALPDIDFARPFLSLGLADCYRETKDFHKAIDICKKILETPGLAPATLASAHFNMGLTYQYGLMEPENAKAAYAKALELNPALKEQAKIHLEKMP